MRTAASSPSVKRAASKRSAALFSSKGKRATRDSSVRPRPAASLPGALHGRERLQRPAVGGLGLHRRLEVAQLCLLVPAGRRHLGRLEEKLGGTRASGGLGGADTQGLEFLGASRSLESREGPVHHTGVRGPQLGQGQKRLQRLGRRLHQRRCATVQGLRLLRACAAGEKEGGAEAALGVLAAGVHLGQKRKRLASALALGVLGHHLLQRVGRVLQRTRGQRGVPEPQLEAEPLRGGEGVRARLHGAPVVGLRRRWPAGLGRELPPGQQRTHVLRTEPQQCLPHLGRLHRLPGLGEELRGLLEEGRRLTGDGFGPLRQQLGQRARVLLDARPPGGKGRVRVRGVGKGPVLGGQGFLLESSLSVGARRLEVATGGLAARLAFTTGQVQRGQRAGVAAFGEKGQVARRGRCAEGVLPEELRVIGRRVRGTPGGKEQVRELPRQRRVGRAQRMGAGHGVHGGDKVFQAAVDVGRPHQQLDAGGAVPGHPGRGLVVRGHRRRAAGLLEEGEEAALGQGMPRRLGQRVPEEGLGARLVREGLVVEVRKRHPGLGPGLAAGVEGDGALQPFRPGTHVLPALGELRSVQRGADAGKEGEAFAQRRLAGEGVAAREKGAPPGETRRRRRPPVSPAARARRAGPPAPPPPRPAARPPLPAGRARRGRRGRAPPRPRPWLRRRTS